jgi:glycosyltransferase involved in cell wall biosynthesis
LAAELLRRGHEVDLIVPSGWPSASPYADDLGLKLNKLRGGYDFAFLSHNTTVDVALFMHPELEGRIIQTCHGLFHSLEKPHKNAQIVAISEEVQEKTGGTIIRNAVDLDRFKPSHRLPNKPERLLSLSQSEEFNTLLSDMCKQNGVEFRKRNKHVNPTFRIEEEIQWADIVVGIGRSAIEAMACGRAVFLADQREYRGLTVGGWAAVYAGPECRRNYVGSKPDRIEDWLGVIFRYYCHKDWWTCRNIATYQHNIQLAVNRYLDLTT